jgi:hypothetical protein
LKGDAIPTAIKGFRIAQSRPKEELHLLDSNQNSKNRAEIHVPPLTANRGDSMGNAIVAT